MSVAEAYELPVAQQPLVPPSPPRTAQKSGALSWMRVLRKSALSAWSQRAYEEDIIPGGFFGRTSFTVNTPDAIRHVLVDNYENYSRTPAGMRVLRPILGQGLLVAEGRAWKHQRRTLAPAFTPRAVTNLVPHMIAVTDETIAMLKGRCDKPVDLREVMQRMTLEIAGRTMFSFGMARHGATLSADAVICVIAQAAPTAWIRSPRLESRLASQMRRNTVYRRGAVIPSLASFWRFGCSVISPSIWAVMAGWSNPQHPSDACESRCLSSA